MQEILVLQGLPASGKSTFAKELMEKESGKWKRINKDLLREMLNHSFWSDKDEKIIVDIRDYLIEHFIGLGFNVIVDDTNFSPRHINRIAEVAQECNARMTVKFIDTPLYECIERDSKRQKSVGQKVILNMYNQYLRFNKESKFFEDKPDLFNCIICDIDGTLAYGVQRSPYAYNDVSRDLVNTKLGEIITTIRNQGKDLIIFSGREDSCKEETIKWLNKNKIQFDKLVMRKTGDHRSDEIIKSEMFDEHIKDKYNVLAVFDDRPRVIRMWKEKGLFVLDCNRQDSRIQF